MAQKRINKYLSEAGVCSRRAADSLVEAGKVTVNGKLLMELGTKIDPDVDQIEVNGKPIEKPSNKILLKLHKPRGYETSCKRRYKEKIVTDLIPKKFPRLFPIGRLDKDTTGLLLFTNDGDLAHKMMHPSSNIEREYLVETEEPITDRHIDALFEGVTIDGAHVKPKKIRRVTSKKVRIIVMEGRNREVRRFMEKAELTILQLKRIRFGNYFLDDLALGAIALEKK